MKRILITAAGGAPAINFTRSLKDGSGEYFLLGVDCDKYTIHRAETDVKEMCPRATEDDYIDYINHLIEKYDIEFLHAQPDVEVGVISEARDKLNCKVFLPSKESVRILRDKYLSYESWKKSGVKVPRTILLKNEEDLKRACEIFGAEMWLRETQGAAGKGSLSSPDYAEALKHIERRGGWGRFTAAAMLSPHSVTWMSIYHHGELIVAQTRERLYWEASNRSQSGVTGITGTGRTISDRSIDEAALRAIHAIDPAPHGIFSVDMTYDKSGHPNATEINIGKFFTTHYFFTKAGVNFPEIYVRLGYGEAVDCKNRINPLPVGLNWVRGMDVEPILVNDEEIQRIERMFATEREKRRHHVI